MNSAGFLGDSALFTGTAYGAFAIHWVRGSHEVGQLRVPTADYVSARHRLQHAAVEQDSRTGHADRPFVIIQNA